MGEQNWRYTRPKRMSLVVSNKELISKLQKVINLLRKLIDSLSTRADSEDPIEENREDSSREKILAAAQDALGKDITPHDNVPDEVACAESLCKLIQTVDPTFPMLPYTLDLLNEFKRNPKYKATLDIKPGNLIINASTTGNGKIRGHCGVLMGNDRISSNTSANGRWEDNYSIKKWNERFRYYGGMPTRVFEPI